MAVSIIVTDPVELDWEGWPGEQVGVRGRAEWKTLLDGERDGSEGIAAGLARIAPGEQLAEHSHPQHEAYLVISGTATITVDGEAHRVPAGRAVFIRGGARHSCRNEGEEELRFLFCFPTDSTRDVEYDF